jgi:AcrR family transcriptional regulator
MMSASPPVASLRRRGSVMARSPRTESSAESTGPSVRRRPKQKSSQQIVDAILQAAALLLAREGLDAITTNAVATRAGVSVGSFYRYFPNKTSLVTELARGLEATWLTLVADEVHAHRDARARDLVAKITALSCSPALGTVALRRALLREVPRAWTLAETRASDGLISTLLVDFLATRRGEVRTLDLGAAVFAVQHAVDGVTEAVLLASADTLPHPMIQRELFQLHWSHLARTADTPNGSVAHEAHDPSVLAALLPRRKPGPRRARARSDGACTRAVILEAASRLLDREGSRALGMRRIAAESGLAIGTLYRHFASDRSVYAAVAADLEARTGIEMAVRIPTVGDLSALVDTLVDAYTDETLTSQISRKELLARVPRRWSEREVAPVLRANVELLARGIARLQTRETEPILLAFVALHAVRATSEAFYLLQPPNLTLAELRSELRALVVRYLAAAHAHE